MSALSKLMEARIQLQGMALKKTGFNKFSQYYYFSLADFLPTIQQIFYNLKLAGVVSYGPEIARLVITDLEDGTTEIVTTPMSTAALKGCHEVQNLGAVETYIRRYLWVTALEIVEHEALDSTSTREGTRKENGAIEGKGVIKPTDGALESLTEGMRGTVVDVAAEVENLIESTDYQRAYELSETVTTGSEDGNMARVALYGLLGPRSRAFLNTWHAAIKATTMESLVAAYNTAPKYAQVALVQLFSDCKAKFADK